MALLQLRKEGEVHAGIDQIGRTSRAVQEPNMITFCGVSSIAFFTHRD